MSKKKTFMCVPQFLLSIMLIFALLLCGGVMAFAACSGNYYCGLSTAANTACSSAQIQLNNGVLGCYPSGSPGSNVNCNKKNAGQEQACSCSCKSATNPSAPKVNDNCSCQ